MQLFTQLYKTRVRHFSFSFSLCDFFFKLNFSPQLKKKLSLFYLDDCQPEVKSKTNTIVHILSIFPQGIIILIIRALADVWDSVV